MEIPPNTQGLTALVMLNILENFDVGALDPLGADRFHLVLEAARLGYAIRDTHIADQAHMRTPIEDLLDKKFAKKLASLIDMKKRVKMPSAPTPGNDTVYLTVVDRDRTAVSFINSLYSSFGVGICTEKTGIMLTNRGACFTLEPDHPNTFGRGKRPMHTIIPALAMRNGRCDMSFGVMGAHYQPMGHVQIILNMLDYGMDVQQAIDAPRDSPVAITVVSPPSVQIISPSQTSLVLKSSTVTLSATARTIDSAIARVDYRDGTSKIGSSTVAPYSIL